MLEQQENRRAMPGLEYRAPGMAGGEKRGLLESSPTFDDGLRYTKYGALNAVTAFHDWNTRYNEGDVSMEEKRTINVLFGWPNKPPTRLSPTLPETFAGLVRRRLSCL